MGSWGNRLADFGRETALTEEIPFGNLSDKMIAGELRALRKDVDELKRIRIGAAAAQEARSIERISEYHTSTAPPAPGEELAKE